METLESLSRALPAPEAKELRLDVSSYFGKEEGEVVFLYRDPPLPKIFIAARDTDKFKSMWPSWPRELAVTVSMMSVAHVEPPSEAPGLVYGKLVDEGSPLVTHLMNEFVTAFPHLVNLDAAAAEKKSA